MDAWSLDGSTLQAVRPGLGIGIFPFLFMLLITTGVRGQAQVRQVEDVRCAAPGMTRILAERSWHPKPCRFRAAAAPRRWGAMPGISGESSD
jgi:hypothetical protein